MSDVSTGESTGLSTLVEQVHEVVKAGRNEQKTTCAVAELLERSLRDGLTIPTQLTDPHPDRYVMYPLYVAEDGTFSIASAVWNVGQSTPIHDHGTWGVVGIYSGAEAEERFKPPTESAGPQPLAAKTWAPGEVTICCTTDQDLHRVSCAGDEPCVGIHVYGADIGTLRRRHYHPETGEIGYFVSAWATPDVGRLR